MEGNHKLYIEREVKAFVLCAGKGTRLGQRTEKFPKPMLKVCGIPILEHAIRLLKTYNINEIGINLHYKPEKITNYFGDGNKFGVELKYFYEKDLMGTAGALKNAQNWFLDEQYFLVLYGDIITNLNINKLISFHEYNNNPFATICLHKRNNSNSIVKINNKNLVTFFDERPLNKKSFTAENHYINSGIQILNKKILNFIPLNTEFDLPQNIYSKIYKKQSIYGYCLNNEIRIAIDSPERLELANREISSKNTLFPPPIVVK